MECQSHATLLLSKNLKLSHVDKQAFSTAEIVIFQEVPSGYAISNIGKK
jgi:hypothetical protein